MAEAMQGAGPRETGPWANLPASKDPASPHYLYHPEHERLSSMVPSAITSPYIIPALPGFIAYWTGINTMYGVQGRDSVYVIAMRRRAELLPRPFTQTEHAILGRYSQNMQNGSEYFGLMGLVGGALHAVRTEYWPMEKSVRTMLGATGTAESAPPSGFIYPNGWGQNEGGTSAAGAASAATSTTNPTAGSASTAANSAESTIIPPRSGRYPPIDPPMPRIDVTKISEDYLRGPRVTPPPPLMNYSWGTALQRWFYMLQMPPHPMVNFTMWQLTRLRNAPPHQRDTDKYKQFYELVERFILWSRDWALLRDRSRLKMKSDFDKERARAHEYTNPMAQKEIMTLGKELDEFDKKMAEARKAWAERTAAAGEIEAAIIARRPLDPNAKPAPLPRNWAETEEYQKALKEAKELDRAAMKERMESARSPSLQDNGEAPRKTTATATTRSGNFKMIKDAFRVGTWAFFGKYVVGTIGLIWLTSRSRQMEVADERLQEFNYDRTEYAKLRMKETAARRGLPVPPPAPLPQQHGEPTHGEPTHGDEGESGTRRPDRFESVDNQSLGGVQSESIDWGDFVKDDTPVVARQQSNDSRLPPLRPGESAWDRARRAREGPQGPAMEEDRWAPQGQQDTAPKTDDMANMSRWERIRQQSSEGYGSERRVPGENRDGGDGSGSFSGFGRRQQGQDRQKTKEELQREFDAQVEKERRGEEGSWK
ncbi:hypothetical protein TWF225_009280 [Orbilia oligospora]|nr:hypothetical protein TWF225_009280 [Orbilia oligospora]KAF3269919.1 hypothetical protein TWF217_008264 [Orbilia oligospora]KAF3270378.1 hypothetical protein TWF128_004155 [Orbilia oligospora]KAF3298134.1 hypothetical protein TWF132_004272 [Orbilia oligospora]